MALGELNVSDKASENITRPKIKKDSGSLRAKAAGRLCRKMKIFPFLIISVEGPLRRTHILFHFAFLFGSLGFVISG